MFFKEYKLTDSTTKVIRRVIVAAMLGERPRDDSNLQEKEGFREVFYTAMDITHTQGVKDWLDEWKGLAKAHLAETLDSYNLVPLPDDLDFLEKEMEKSLMKGYMQNRIKKQFLMHQLSELEDQQGAILADMADQQPKELLKK